MRVANLFQPWYLYRPGQLVRRVVRAVRSADPVQVVRLPWGCEIECDIREAIGASLWTAGVYDLAVTEVLHRLTDPSLLAVDVGANIGVMTGVMASRGAEVWALEPCPPTCRRLEANAARLAGLPGFGSCRVFEVAASDAEGEAGMDYPEMFAINHGMARVVPAAGAAVVVAAVRLDQLLGDRVVGVMKVDVEEHELAALRGAEAALAAGRIRHVVFEEYAGPDSPACRLLARHGYTVFALGRRFSGPVVAPTADRAGDATNYLATRSPDDVLARCNRRGWRCLGSRCAPKITAPGPPPPRQ